MKKGWVVVICLFVVIVLGVLALIFIPSPKVVQAPSPTASTSTTATPTGAASLDDLITVASPLPNSSISSTTIVVTGQARGTWYFEASAPIALLDENGGVIAQGTIQAQGEWMTTDYVPFSGSLTFPAQPAGSSGTLVLTNDNPSGDPTKQKTLDIPVTF